MEPTDSLASDAIWEEDPFRFISPDAFESLGIDSRDIPLGTFPALRHPSQIPSRFGGNAFGFGLFETHDRLKAEDIQLLQSTAFENAEDIARHYRKINEIYKKLGLLTRFSRLGKPYYLIPAHLVSTTRMNVKAKIQELSKIIGHHRTKYFKEQYRIGILTHTDDLILHDLSFQFKEHHFVALDSLDTLQRLEQALDLVLVTRDLYEVLIMERFTPLPTGNLSKKRLDQHAMYILWKLYNSLKPEGELAVIATHYVAKSNQTMRVRFKSVQEEKNFTLFSHIFKTKKRYRIKDHALEVNIFDFQHYLSGPYVEHDVVSKLLDDRDLEGLTLDEVDDLPYLNFRLSAFPMWVDQEKSWSKLMSVYFHTVFLKPIIAPSVREEWKKRFTFKGQSPKSMLIYLGEKKPLKMMVSDITSEVANSRLIGCPIDLCAEYRDTFEYVIRTLRVIEKLKTRNHEGLPPVYLDRLRQPLENRKRRFPALNDVIRLTEKAGQLEKVRDSINPDNVEGTKTKVIKNLAAFAFFGFTRDELKEILYIVLGHTSMGRIVSGKMSEKTLKPVSELAKTYELQQALNLLRYCRLMTMAEIEAARGVPFSPAQLSELFDLYESAVRIVTIRDLDWDTLLDEKISAMGGVRNKVIRKLLKMTNHFEFLETWPDLRQKGRMEKEALADYDEEGLSRIENVIGLVDVIEHFESMYLKSDPLQIPAFYRKLLQIEFHGTGHLFGRMKSKNVFVLIWIAVNLAPGEIINFNPILADVEPSEADERISRVEEEANSININYLDLAILKEFGNQLRLNSSAFIAGTGFQLKVDPSTQALEIAYLDMERDIEQLERLSGHLAGSPIHEIPQAELLLLETLFSNLESFYQSHLRLLNQIGPTAALPTRQKRWFQKTKGIRESLRSAMLDVMFQPDTIHSNLDLLHRQCPTLLSFLLPELAALEGIDLSGHLYVRSSIISYILTTARKLQALIRHDRQSFHDVQLLHRLAGVEFGPMATGIVGVSEAQLEELEKIVDRLKTHPHLFQALVEAPVFQDMGRVPALRKKYGAMINPADPSQAGALFLERENIPEEYRLGEEEGKNLIFLVRYHSLLHHVLRGEAGFAVLKAVVQTTDEDLFDALFVLSFVMISALREDLTLEDLADRLFDFRTLSKKIIRGTATFEAEMEELFVRLGKMSYALKTYERHGLPSDTNPMDYLKSIQLRGVGKSQLITAGKRASALERLFRLRGLRYVWFSDLLNLLIRIPLKYIYKKRKFSSIGYASFEKEIYEALRLYNMLQNLPAAVRHYILAQLDGDKVRIYGYEKVSGYLSYENQPKLLLIALLAVDMISPPNGPISLDFLAMSEKIDKRYEAVNDYLNGLELNKLWKDKKRIKHFFGAKTGLLLRRREHPGVISVDFHDHKVNMMHKISYMDTITDVDQLKNYFHYSLRSLRKHPFYTDDYELQLEDAFERRLHEITEMMVEQTRRKMELLTDFEGLHRLVENLLERSWDIGFSDDQKYRLSDLYELRKDRLKRDKLTEIDGVLATIKDPDELTDYWNSIKSFLQTNRHFTGKGFESMIARKFDETKARFRGG